MPGALSLRSVADKSSNEARRRAELESGFECNSLRQMGSRGKSMKQPCPSQGRIETQLAQYASHQCRYPSSRLQSPRHISISKNAIISLSRGCAAKRGHGSQRARQFVGSSPDVIQRVRVFLLRHNQAGSRMSVAEFPKIEFGSR